MKDLKILFHLTARGWREGQRWYTDEVQGELVDPLDNTLAIYELHIQRGSGIGKDRRHWAEVWRSAQASAAEILRAKMLYQRPDENSDAP